MSENKNDVIQHKNIGHALFKEVSFEIGGMCISKQRSCKKCHQDFEVSDGDDYIKMWRELEFKKGDLDYCYECDSDVSDKEECIKVNEELRKQVWRDNTQKCLDKHNQDLKLFHVVIKDPRTKINIRERDDISDMIDFVIRDKYNGVEGFYLVGTEIRDFEYYGLIPIENYIKCCDDIRGNNPEYEYVFKIYDKPLFKLYQEGENSIYYRHLDDLPKGCWKINDKWYDPDKELYNRIVYYWHRNLN